MNFLSKEKSPYLLQHADNPVLWYPWGEQALAKARLENKPILLSIGYSTCHWCHVMAHESFEDEGIAAYLNAHFVSIKVDREERPDLDHIYMSAVTAITGQGGWPLTVFLTPHAKPFYGGTYFPPVAKWGSPGFMDLLKSISDAWASNQAQMLASSEEITRLLRNAIPPAAQGGIDQEILAQAYKQMFSQFDRQYGGFGGSPKFPMGHNLSLLLRYYKRSGQAEALGIVEQTLTAMAQGGIYDHLGGGFHRYSTDREWQVPHFEKMLYDQALLVMAYTECYQVTGNILYAEIVQETLDYVLRDMTDPQGGFYCAEDADSEGREGAFYVWTEKEIVEVLGQDEAEPFIRRFGVKSNGNVTHDPHGEFTHCNILFTTGQSAVEADGLEAAKKKLFDRRILRPRPHLDDKILTDWNGLMIAAFAFAGCVFGKDNYVRAAVSAADFILKHLNHGDQLLHRWRQGEASIDGMLEDHAFLALGLTQVYEATFEESYLKEAYSLADQMIARFSDKVNGGFFMTPSTAEDLIIRPQEVYDGAQPSGNSVAAYVCVKLYYFSHKEEYRAQSEAVFKRFMGSVERAPQAHTFFITALDLYLTPPVDICLSGSLPNKSIIANLQKVVYKHFIPGKVVRRESGDEEWSIRVCRDRACLPGTQELSQLEQSII